MILVTGAGGKTGKAVIRALGRQGADVRAFVRRAESVAEVQALGARDGVAGDLHDPAALRSACAGIRAVYHICPNVHPDEVALGLAAIAAAQAAGVSHFVYHSVLHPQVEAMPHHWNKLRVEAALFESGLPFTILQPAVYMQNILAGWAALVERGVYTVPYPVDTPLSQVDLEDVAAVAARVLTEDEHVGATYELAGTSALTPLQMAAELSRQLRRPVRAEAEPVEAWEQRAQSAGLGAYQVATLRAMFVYYAQSGLAGNPNLLAWLLRRPPASLADFAARTAEERWAA